MSKQHNRRKKKSERGVPTVSLTLEEWYTVWEGLYELKHFSRRPCWWNDDEFVDGAATALLEKLEPVVDQIDDAVGAVAGDIKGASGAMEDEYEG